MARVVAPKCPHHITQRGNRRQTTFFEEADYNEYKRFMSEWCKVCHVQIWAYCMMPNHVHLIAVPATEEGLRRAIGEAHRRYTRYINVRNAWRGYLWQGRFSSFPMDERYLLAAARYVEMNPVRARLVTTPEEYEWSSAAAHIKGQDDGFVTVSPLREMAGDWRQFLGTSLSSDETQAIRLHEKTGRPLGTENFIDEMEETLHRTLRRVKPGPKPKKGNYVLCPRVHDRVPDDLAPLEPEPITLRKRAGMGHGVVHRHADRGGHGDDLVRGVGRLCRRGRSAWRLRCFASAVTRGGG
ncbi:transposase [Candidatus Methylomirabilis sp.]|uniref:transposase n=1 Tax=Candidatus Methylomirabilis sp. TaxID=2032687 RepID=UPI0030760FFB